MISKCISKDEIKNLNLDLRTGLNSDDDLNFCRVKYSNALKDLIKKVCITNEIKKVDLNGDFSYNRYLVRDGILLNLDTSIRDTFFNTDLISKGTAVFKFTKQEYAEQFKVRFERQINILIEVILQND